MEASERLHRLAKDALEEYNKGVAAGGEPIYPAWADDMFVVHTLLKRKAFAFDEWLEKTNWVQEQIKTFPLASLGKHRADVLREEIERLRLITHVDHDQLAAIRAGLDAAAQVMLRRAEQSHWRGAHTEALAERKGAKAIDSIDPATVKVEPTK